MSIQDQDLRAAEVLKLREALKMVYDLLEDYAPHGTERRFATRPRLLCL
jgi:hypothetical protein